MGDMFVRKLHPAYRPVMRDGKKLGVKLTVERWCDDDDCVVSIRIPLTDNPGDYGWFRGNMTDEKWLFCPKHNPHLMESELVKNALANIMTCKHVNVISTYPSSTVECIDCGMTLR